MLGIGEQVQREAQAQGRCAADVKVNMVNFGLFDLGVHLRTDFKIKHKRKSLLFHLTIT